MKIGEIYCMNLFDFLENWHPNTLIIVEVEDNIIFEGTVKDIPLEISCKYWVQEGTVRKDGEKVVIPVEYEAEINRRIEEQNSISFSDILSNILSIIDSHDYLKEAFESMVRSAHSYTYYRKNWNRFSIETLGRCNKERTISTKEDGEGYFNKLMMEIRQDVDKTFVNKPIIRKRLYELVDEVDFIINSCEVPGVPDNWLKLNPNIKYFDSVFDIIEENPELYKSIKNEHLRGNPIQFNFFPSKQEIAERQKYFEEKRQKYPTRTIDRFYQDELVETLNKRFNQCLEKIANI